MLTFGNCPTEYPSLKPTPVPSQNVALNKPATQSTNMSSNVASRAVDGKISTMSRTDWQKNPNWQVNLKSVYEIKTIKLSLNKKAG